MVGGRDKELKDVTVDASAASATASAPQPRVRIEPLLDSIRLAVLGIIASIGVTVGLTVGFSVSWLSGVLMGVASVAVVVAMLKVRRLRVLVTKFARWVLPLDAASD